MNEIANKLNNISTEKYNISLGFDGYVDEIISAVSTRTDINNFTPINTITQFGNRILSAAGKSTNVELHTNHFKLGGNGPIMGNSIAAIGSPVNYIGALGFPHIHDVFKSLNEKFKQISISEPGHTRAVEFDDGKIMFGKLAMTDLTWNRIIECVPEKELQSFFTDCDLLGMVNWTQTPYMTDIWSHLIDNYLPSLNFNNKKPYLFIDLADPEKRSPEDIITMLKLLSGFEKFYKVILGLNEKESYEIAEALKISSTNKDSIGLQSIAKNIQEKLKITVCVIHPVKFAVCSFNGKTYSQEGPYVPNPLISTGAGDHFNAGFAFGLMAGLTPHESLLLGVSNSGYYVRTAKSASLTDLKNFINDWQK